VTERERIEKERKEERLHSDLESEPFFPKGSMDARISPRVP
jgi:hypothetical protein